MADTASDGEFVNDDELLFDRAFSALPELDSLPPSAIRQPLPPLPPPRQSDLHRARPREQVALRPGDIVAGKYQVERMGGRVGAAALAYVSHTELRQPLQLKYLSSDASAQPDAATRFLRGARVAMRLQSEHTARTIDAGRLASGAPYVVTEACSGSDLREVLRVRGLLTLTESVDFVLQAAESVAEAHAQGLVHRGLNLSKLVVTRRPDGSALIKVQDFGVADAVHSDPALMGGANADSASAFEPSPALDELSCLAPEQIRGSTEVDERADIWALAAILQHILSGRPVYNASTPTGLLVSIVADPPMPITAVRSDVPAALEGVILRCFEKDRAARFASLADFAAALQRFASIDTQGAVERITRTLGRATQSAPLMAAAGAALIHVGPAIVPQPASAPLPMHQPAPPMTPYTGQAQSAVLSVPAHPHAAVVHYPLVWSALLVAFGLVGGTIAGVLIATRPPVTAAQPALEQRVQAERPAAAEWLPPPVALPEPAAQTQAAVAEVPAPRSAQRPRSSAPIAAPRPRPIADSGESTADKEPLRTPPKPAAASASAQSADSAQSVPKQSEHSAVPRAQSANDLFDSVR